jgi:AraC-like DNA-binding protein
LPVKPDNGRQVECLSPAVQLPVTQPKVTTPDEQLISRATAIVEEHISDSDFSVEQLAELLGMHRSNLTRRLNVACGLTPLNFIRRIRLLRARHLIEQGQMMVSEAAYAVGYNSPKLFSRQFKEEFGITPSELRHSDN